jgi:PhnB protein
MMRLDPYLNFNGNTEEVFNFYKKVFKRDFTSLMRFADMPGGEKMSPADKTKILHVALPVGDSVLMGTDVLDSMNQKISTGDNFSISITVDSEAEATRIFEALSDRGDVIMPLGKEFWSDLFGICKDPFGIQWMINFKANQK